ncbi:NAD-dependent succinate-semialdehyde dehydrogenase [uncultured Methylovirgula sp.]|uniref:NAD-dependent succinate-semialdehyde dehydrogenase n=1 Tax=uncultured Methylovirgula sp. TaxID=1285960 RepID=UPI00260DBB7F|nr:NAD-dependent succinate-semialdehyde dehydrogenase [uncultured Methylovirgula sp.]
MDVLLYIDGRWQAGAAGRRLEVINPATEEVIGTVARAETADLDAALSAAQKGFAAWRDTSAFERGKILRRAAALLRERIESIAVIMTGEQGKPLKEAKVEIGVAADTLDWFADEARRAYGRTVPARAPDITNLVLKEPVGPVAAFTPWNFPINQIARKLGAALAAGCSMIVKAPEEAPGSPAQFIRAVADAGVPPGVVNLVFGVPAEISQYLIPHPAIRKISFTGSTAVGKELAALAGAHMKRATMELGGHAPAIVFADADLDVALRVLLARKFRNAGQACTAPTRFLVQRDVYQSFLTRFAAAAQAMKIGDGADPATDIGPLANPRRIAALETFVADAVENGAKLVTGGHRLGNKGYFFAPTVLAHVPTNARAMNEEPFGPIALVNAFETFEEAITEANRLAYGLASYAFTSSAATADALARQIEAGMVAINDSHLSSPELPIGGVKDSGYGSEGGPEAMDAYLVTKLVTQAAG